MAGFFSFCFPSSRKPQKPSSDDSYTLTPLGPQTGPQNRRDILNQRVLTNLSQQAPRGLSNHSASVPPPLHNGYNAIYDEMLRNLASALTHSQYILGGRCAMYIWACIDETDDETIVLFCPMSLSQSTKLWLTSYMGQGGLFHPSETDSELVLYTTRTLRSPIRIRVFPLVDSQYDRLSKTQRSVTYTDRNKFVQSISCSVLTLPALLNNAAEIWANNTAGRSASEKQGLAQDILSILERIIVLGFSVKGAGPLTRRECPAVLEESFWRPFTRTYRRARSLFEQCGLSPSDAGVVPRPLISPRANEHRPSSRPNNIPSGQQHPSTNNRNASNAGPITASRTQIGRSLTRPSLTSTGQTASSSRHSSSSRTTTPLPGPTTQRSPHSNSHSSSTNPRHSSHSNKASRNSRTSITSSLCGSKCDANTVDDAENLLQEQRDAEREAHRRSAEFAARRQRGIERDRERAWHAGKAQQRMDNGTHLG